MATAGTTMEKKRKSSSMDKGQFDGKAKKARVESLKPNRTSRTSRDEPFQDDSDSEDGGVELSPEPAEKQEKSQNGKTAAKAFEKGANSRESHAKQKQLAQERKAAKPLADELQRTKKIWERLRIKSSVPKDERKKLVDELYGIITGRVRDFVLKHDAVRAVQTAIKYSTPEQRKQIARELRGTYPQLAESRYAKFLIGKLMVQGDKEIRDLIIPEFYGKVRRLINHPEASWIVDDIYRAVATSEQRATLLREWYGAEFALREMTKQTEVIADLKQILENEPSKRGPIMKSLWEMINSLIQKNMTGFTMLHDAMLQYFTCVNPGTEEFSEFFELVKGDENGDLMKNLAFTRPGARLVSLLLAHGTSKDRKQLLKTYKDTFLMMSADPNAHVVILTAYDVIDDTKLTAKSVFPELLGEGNEDLTQNLVASANNIDARKSILYLFEGMSKALFPTPDAFDVAILNEVHEIRKTTSKKDDDVRQKELMAALSPHLLPIIASSPSELAAAVYGHQLIADVLLFGAGEKQEALEAVASLAGGDPKATIGEGDEAKQLHISQTPSGARMIKSLIQGGRFDKASGKVMPVDPPLRFADVLYPIIKDHILDWATGTGSFVIVGLLEADDFSHGEQLKKMLAKNKKLLEKASVEETAEQRAWRENQEQNPPTNGTAGKKKKKGERPVGNMGSKILLEKLTQ